MMKAIGYCRISTQDQSRYSLEGQERAISQYCQTNNLDLLNVFKDDGESSYSFDRPDWKALEAFIKKNKAVEFLIIYDHDRFSRNLAEALIKIKELYDKYGIKVLATSDNINTDFSDPSTFMMRAFKFMMAESELHRIRKRTRDGYIEASLKGLYVNKAPYGFLNSRDASGNPYLKIDEEKAVIVRKIFSEYARGATIEEIRKTITPYGYTQKGSSAIQRILSNPVYAGLIKVPAHRQKPEQIIKGVHQGIVSENEYWTAQNRLTGNQRIGHHSNEDVPLKGVLRCHCGRMMSASNPKSKSGKTFWYYVCSLHRKNISAKKAHSQLDDMLDLFSLNPVQLKWFEKKFGEEIQKFLYTRAGSIAAAEKSLRIARDKIANAEERYLLQEGKVNQKSYDKVMAALKMQEGELVKRVQELSENAESYWKKLNQLLTKLHDIRGAYLMMNFMQRQQFLNTVFYNNLTHDGKVFRTPFIIPMFAHNLLELNNRGLLISEQPSGDLGETPGRTAYGSIIEHLNSLNRLFAA